MIRSPSCSSPSSFHGQSHRHATTMSRRRWWMLPPRTCGKKTGWVSVCVQVWAGCVVVSWIPHMRFAHTLSLSLSSVQVVADPADWFTDTHDHACRSTTPMANMVQWRALIRCGMEWYGIVWYGMKWYGMVCNQSFFDALIHPSYWTLKKQRKEQRARNTSEWMVAIEANQRSRHGLSYIPQQIPTDRSITNSLVGRTSMPFSAKSQLCCRNLPLVYVDVLFSIHVHTFHSAEAWPRYQILSR